VPVVISAPRQGERRPVRVLELRSVRGVGGGPEKTILLGAACSDPARVSVTVCYLRDRRDDLFEIDRRARQAGVDYVEILERHSLDPTVWPRLRRLVRDGGHMIVHSHDYKTDLLAYLLSRAESVIPLATVHGWSGHSLREQRLYYPVDRRLLARFPHLIAVSQGIRHRLVEAGADERRVEVLLNGIDDLKFKRDPARIAEARARFGIQQGEVVIGSVGRLEWLKRFDVLIDAFARVHRANPTTMLLVAGEGSERPRLQQQIARLGLQHACRLIGQCSNIVDFHHALDVFVQSSATEGAPNVILEAMAMETPVVATDVGGTCELLRRGVDGLAVPAGDSAAMADAIAGVLTDSTGARRRASAARARVERDLSFRVRMAKLNGVYERLADRERARQTAGGNGHHA
jgi:glycosyltransferase involved in cell wall biosynthesis